MGEEIVAEFVEGNNSALLLLCFLLVVLFCVGK